MSESKLYLSQVIRDNLRIARKDRDTHLTGKLLTLVDAIFSDPEQRKAVKDNIQSILMDDRTNSMNNNDHVCSDMYKALKEKNLTPGEGESDPSFVNNVAYVDGCVSMDYKNPLDKDVDLTR